MFHLWYISFLYFRQFFGKLSASKPTSTKLYVSSLVNVIVESHFAILSENIFVLVGILFTTCLWTREVLGKAKFWSREVSIWQSFGLGSFDLANFRLRSFGTRGFDCEIMFQHQSKYQRVVWKFSNSAPSRKFRMCFWIANMPFCCFLLCIV